MDDRECSTRRYLESELPSVETFGIPGFYGLDCLYLPDGSEVLEQRCPAPIRPKHLVMETRERAAETKKGKVKRSDLLHGRANTFLSAWVTAQLGGVWSGIHLAFQVLFPRLGLGTVTAIGRMPEGVSLLWKKEENSPRPLPTEAARKLQLGYDFAESAQRVEGFLRASGLTSSFAPWVALIGHGASSSNNPHFAAYDCGACSGRPGASNARVAAEMANHPEVRKLLSERGIQIPADTYFVGGIHDTTRDRIEFFDLDRIAPHQFPGFQELQKALEKVLALNALERCRKFEVVDYGQALTPKKARDEVEHRAMAIFEPRPEMNHATNAMCIVARRSLTEGMDLDRRSFLQSYNGDQDPEGKILAAILSAAIPVCGGINLEYFFSRVDNDVYGAGTKLPHNVVGLVAVANGVNGDLRTGLPSQMIEIHDPVRLFVVIEQKNEIVKKAIRSVPSLESWVKNSWVRVISLDPSTGARNEVTHV